MKAKKITEEEIADLKIASLPTRPTAPSEYGGIGYTSKQMREAFDKLSLFVIERFNELIDDIETESTDSIIHKIQIGYDTGLTLFDFVCAFNNGTALTMIPVGDLSLAEYLFKLNNNVELCMSELGIGE